MKNLRQHASWHERRPRVHRCAVLAFGALLLVACGPSTASTTGAGDGTGDETGEPDDEILWTYGGGDRPVLSWPVTDKDGNVFVLVGVDAVADGDGHQVQEVRLVSLSDAGVVRWSVTVAGATRIPRATAVRPAIGVEQDAWVHYDDELLRVSGGGEVRWRTGGLPHPQGYLSGDYTATVLGLATDGTCYLLPLLDESSPPLRQEVRAIAPDGNERWRATVGLAGFSGADLSHFPTETDAPLVAPDGGVFIGCDTCEPDRIGLAHVDALTGEATMLSSRTGQYAHYERLRWDGEAVWVEFDADVWRVTPEGFAETHEELPSLVVDAGPVGIVRETVTNGGFSLRWGTETIIVDMSGTFVEGNLGVVGPVAALDPPGILLSARTDASPEVQGLLLIDQDGSVVWEVSGTFIEKETIPAIGDGFIAYIEDDGQRLVAVKAPVTGVADGPWPIIGGNPQGTRSAE